jgi:hypothetical protein
MEHTTVPGDIDRAVDALTGPHGARTVTATLARHVCEQLAQRAYQAGRDAAIMELRTSDQAADAVGRSGPWVRAAATRHGVGWRVGRDWVFRPDDIERLRAIAAAAKPGRPPRRPT